MGDQRKKSMARKEATGQCAPDLKRKNSFLTKVQSNRTTGRGKKWWTNGAIMPQKRTERSRSGRVCTVTTEPSHHRYSLPPVKRHHHQHHHHHHHHNHLHRHRSVRIHHHYDGDTKTMIMMVVMTWLSHSSSQLVQLKGAGKARVTKYFQLHPHNFQLFTQWLLDILFGFLYPFSFKN